MSPPGELRRFCFWTLYLDDTLEYSLETHARVLHSWLTIRESLCPAWRSDAVASAWGEGRSQTVTFGCFCGRVDGNPVSVKGLGLMLKICFCFIPEIVFSVSVVEKCTELFSLLCDSTGNISRV